MSWSAPGNWGRSSSGWQDIRSYDAWMQAFAEQGLDPEWYARRERKIDEVLPWEHINAGVSKEFLTLDYMNSLKGSGGRLSRDLRFSCGILGLFKRPAQRARRRLGLPRVGPRQAAPAGGYHTGSTLPHVNPDMGA
ncbi:MAG: hypothetical protein M9927_13085 [Anaerolineae bacterium]|nr:hypothetical protein [Anaerolineae bacterium]